MPPLPEPLSLFTNAPLPSCNVQRCRSASRHIFAPSPRTPLPIHKEPPVITCNVQRCRSASRHPPAFFHLVSGAAGLPPLPRPPTHIKEITLPLPPYNVQRCKIASRQKCLALLGKMYNLLFFKKWSTCIENLTLGRRCRTARHV